MPILKSDYQSPSLLFNSHLQTIIPAIFRRVKGVNYERERIMTPDDDFLDLDWHKENNNQLLILSHGLEGDSYRPYIQGMVSAFAKEGWDCVAWNFRGCSGEVNKQLRFYHSGATDDLELVIHHALTKTEYKKIILMGFSLGGNLTLKYLGEKGGNIPAEVKKAVVFSVPMDLYGSSLKISEPSQYIYSRRFLKNLKAKVKAKSVIMPEKLNITAFDSIKKLKEFDDHYTAPLHGFKDALHYYKTCSSLYYLKDIKLKTLIINAQNDPFLSKECYPFHLLEDHPSIYFEAPTEGGHCGFALFNNKNLYWSEMRALQFVNND